MYAGGGYRHNKILHRNYKLVKANALRTNGMGKEYSIKKADNTAYDSCAGQDEGSPEKVLFRHTDILWFFCKYMHKMTLTEQAVSVKVITSNPTKTLGIKEVSG